MSAAAFGVTVLITALAGVAAVLSSRISERLRIPAPAFFLIAAAAAADFAVFVAGILIADEPAPCKREITRFHSALASLAEIVAFTVLGLTIQLHRLFDDWAWLAGLVLAVLLSTVIRPLLVGTLLWPVYLRRGERVYVLWAGLKGAVPILLGASIVQAGVTGAQRLYQVIFVVVAFSVIVQGGTVPWLLRRLRVPLRTVEPKRPQPGAWRGTGRGGDHGNIRARQAGRGSGKVVSDHGSDGAGGRGRAQAAGTGPLLSGTGRVHGAVDWFRR